MRMIAGVPWGRGVKRQWAVDDGNFSVFAGYFFGNFRDKASIVI